MTNKVARKNPHGPLKRNKALFALLGSLSSLCLQGGVFDDARFWFNGGKPSHGDGTAVTGDFFDSVHANDPSHKNHGCKFIGYDENHRLEKETVTIPLTGESETRQVLRFRDVVKNSGAGDKTFPASLLLNDLRDNLVVDGVPTEQFTVIMRVRRDGRPSMPNETEWFFEWGYGYQGKEGIMLGFVGDDSKAIGKQIEIYHAEMVDGAAKGLHPKIGSGNASYVPTNVWVDIGISLSNGTARIAMVKENNSRTSESGLYDAYPYMMNTTMTDFVEVTKLFASSASKSTAVKDCFFIFGLQRNYEGLYDSEREWTVTTKSSNFKGSLQQLAIWDRALSFDEMQEAFAAPRPHLLRVGLENGGSGEFGGSRPEDGVRTYDVSGNVCESSAVFRSGDKATMTFVGRAEEAGLRQYATMNVLGSTPCKFSLSVNGVDCGPVQDESGGCLVWCVPPSVTVSGVNIVTLQRTDTGASPVEMDAFTLGGSWQVGVEGTGESYSSAYDVTPDFIGGPNVRTALWPNMFATYELTKDIRIRIWVDKVVAERGYSSMTIPITMKRSPAPETEAGKHLCFWVNGNVKRDEAVSGLNWDVGVKKIMKLDFGPGELLAGWNELVVQFLPFDSKYEATKSAYSNNDFYRFEVGRLRRGMCLIVR